MRKYVECSITHGDTPTPNTILVFDLRLMTQLKKKYLGNFPVNYGSPAAFLFGISIGLEEDHTLFAVINDVKYKFTDRTDEYAKSVFLPGELKIDTTAFSTFQATQSVPQISEPIIERCLFYKAGSGTPTFLVSEFIAAGFPATGSYFYKYELDSTYCAFIVFSTTAEPALKYGQLGVVQSVSANSAHSFEGGVHRYQSAQGNYGVIILNGPASQVNSIITNELGLSI